MVHRFNIDYGSSAIGTTIVDVRGGGGSVGLTSFGIGTSYMTKFTLVVNYVCIRGDPFNVRLPLFQKILISGIISSRYKTTFLEKIIIFIVVNFILIILFIEDIHF